MLEDAFQNVGGSIRLTDGAANNAAHSTAIGLVLSPDGCRKIAEQKPQSTN